MNATAPSASLEQVELRWGVRIPLSDGVQLHANAYLPRDLEMRMPVIFTLTPYGSQRYHDEALYFAGHGYAFLSVDARGRGNSQGEFRALLGEGRDGAEIVAWLADQPYCDGQVAMWGGSYMGHVQWTTAARSTRALKTISPFASPYIGVDFPLRNNLFATYLMQWITLVSGKSAQDVLCGDAQFWRSQCRCWMESGQSFHSLDAAVGNPSALFQEWLAHPSQGEYWDRFNPTAFEYAGINIPVLTITGLYDGDQLGALAHHRAHLAQLKPAARARHFLVIGPWEHGGMRVAQGQCAGLKTGPASLVDFRALHVQWYDWIMRDGERPEFLKKNVAYYVLGAEEWRYADSLEEIGATSRVLFLHSTINPTDVSHSGELSNEAPSGDGPDEYVYDPHDVSLADLESTVDIESAVDQRMTFAASDKQLVYHSLPFDSDVEVAGFFKLRVWIALDVRDTDFRVTVWDVDSDGSALMLTSDQMRARYRESLREERLIATPEPLRYDFESFTFTARLLRRGHRLRLVLGPINSIFAEKNFNGGGVAASESLSDARSATVSLFHDERHPSALVVPWANARA
jgi:uncharacterized protein